jgi:hypothetical protein
MTLLLSANQGTKGRNSVGAQARRVALPLVLNLRRGILGFRRADVRQALETQRRQLTLLADSVDRLWAEKLELQSELAGVRAEAERHAGELEARAAQVEAESRAAAARLLAGAEEQAAEIRQDASLRVGDAVSRLDEVIRVREQLLGEIRGILSAYGDLLAQAEQGRIPTLAPQFEAAVSGLAAQAVPQPPRLAEVRAATGLFPRVVEIDAGPFTDFAELSAFERSLARVPKVRDVYVRRFDHDRAEIELGLSEETPLLHELTRHLPYRLSINGEDSAHLTIDLVPEAAEG